MICLFQKWSSIDLWICFGDLVSAIIIMSGAPRGVRSSSEMEVRPVLGPAGNKTTTVGTNNRKPLSKFVRPNSKADTPPPEEDKRRITSPSQEDESSPRSQSQSLLSRSSSLTATSLLRRRHEQQQQLLHSNLSLNASCSSDVSSDSLQSRASTGKIGRSTITSIRRRRKQCLSKSDTNSVVSDTDSTASSLDLSSHPHSNSGSVKRCAWVTPNTEACYAAFHDEEWGVPVHDDKKLFELLVFAGALAELPWPSILMKRQMFREVFADFEPQCVAKLNEKKMTTTGAAAIMSQLSLSELKLRAVVENARQISKIIDEFGSFDKYIWSFVNGKPIVNKFRYPRQVPAKTSKAEVISKDLIKRGFRSVSATVIYSFMQVAGLTNDHLTTCFRYQHCIIKPPPPPAALVQHNNKTKEDHEDEDEDELTAEMDDLSFPSIIIISE